MNNSDKAVVSGVRGAVLGGTPVDVLRLAPADDLRPFVRHTWFVSWQIPPGDMRAQAVLPPPAVNVTVQPDEDAITGVQSRAGTRELVGRGWVCGILFEPAGFAALVGPTLDQWVDRVDPVTPTLAAVDDLRATLVATDDPADRLRHLEAWLRPQLRRERADEVAAAQRIVERIRDDRSIVRVSGLVERLGHSERALHRLLRPWVGLGPKALIRRYRLLEVAHALHTNPCIDLADLALTLGYADQAHLSRDFARTIGMPPGRYARSLGAGTTG